MLPKLVESMVGGNTAMPLRLRGFGTAWGPHAVRILALLGPFGPVRPAPCDAALHARPGLDYVLMAMAPDLVWLHRRVISGITAAQFSTANAYIADVTAPRTERSAFG